MPKRNAREAGLRRLFYLYVAMALLDPAGLDPYDGEFELEKASVLAMIKKIMSTRYIYARHQYEVKSREYFGENGGFHRLSEDGFLRHFRCNRPTFINLVSYLERTDYFIALAGSKRAAPVWWKVAVTLFRLGHHGNAACIGSASDMFGISIGTVTNWTRQTIAALLEKQNEAVPWPDKRRREEIRKYYMDNFGVDGVVGLLDGTLCLFEVAPSEFSSSYKDRKKRNSMNVQLICDHEKRFIGLSVGHTGKVPDVICWKSMVQCTSSGHFFSLGEFLSTDKGYPIAERIMTPFLESEVAELNDEHNLGLSEKEINYWTKKACHLWAKLRVASEQANGILKWRFASLRGLRFSMKTRAGNENEDENNLQRTFSSFEHCCRWIVACVIAHNLLLRLGHDQLPKKNVDAAIAKWRRERQDTPAPNLDAVDIANANSGVVKATRKKLLKQIFIKLMAE